MTLRTILDRHRGLVVIACGLTPLAVCAVVALQRDLIADAGAALLLALVIVAAASTGIRAAGLVAAVSSAAWYDFFLTVPYGSFVIDGREDVQVTATLLLLGAAITEMALWGRRQQALASREVGQLDGVLTTAELVAASRQSTEALTRRVEDQITEVLGIDDATFGTATGVGGTACVLHPDGTVTRSGRLVDVDRDGLPVDTTIVLQAMSGGRARGRFVLTASTRVVSPSLQQRRISVVLADQAGAAIAAQQSSAGQS